MGSVGVDSLRYIGDLRQLGICTKHCPRDGVEWRDWIEGVWLDHIDH